MKREAIPGRGSPEKVKTEAKRMKSIFWSLLKDWKSQAKDLVCSNTSPDLSQWLHGGVCLMVREMKWLQITRLQCKTTADLQRSKVKGSVTKANTWAKRILKIGFQITRWSEGRKVFLRENDVYKSNKCSTIRNTVCKEEKV